ncbi:pseudouridine synthase, partial [Pseudomonadota bacterium]
MRINKYLADCGICSRREADTLIKDGQVSINGRVAVLGDQVTEKDKVVFEEKTLKPESKKIYIAFHKPFGVISTTGKEYTNRVIDHIKIPERVITIGRLDVESSGILLLTNDGDIVNKLLKSVNKKEKQYVVTVNKHLTKDVLENLKNGVIIDSRKTLPAKIEQISPTQFSITIIEGKNRQ